MADESKLSIDDFAKKIKSRYPEYRDLENATLARKVLEKYPEYLPKVRTVEPRGEMLPVLSNYKPTRMEKVGRWIEDLPIGPGQGEHPRKIRDVVEAAQKPMFPVAESFSKGVEAADPDMHKHGVGIVSAIEGLGLGGADVVEGLSTPENLLMLTGLSAARLPLAVETLVSAGFSAQMAREAVLGFQNGKDALARGDTTTALRFWVSAPVDALFSFLSGRHAFKSGKGAMSELRGKKSPFGEIPREKTAAGNQSANAEEPAGSNENSKSKVEAPRKADAEADFPDVDKPPVPTTYDPSRAVEGEARSGGLESPTLDVSLQGSDYEPPDGASAEHSEDPAVLPMTKEYAESLPTGARELLKNLDQLNDSIQQSFKGKKEKLTDRLRNANSIGDSYSAGKSAVTRGLNNLRGIGSALWSAYKEPPKWSNFDDITGDFLAGLQKSTMSQNQFSRTIIAAVPRKLDRIAISNYIQAGGDEALLNERLQKSKDPYRRGYEQALLLTPEHKQLAQQIRVYLDQKLHQGREGDLLEHAVDNYLTQIWRRKNPFTQKLQSTFRTGLLNPSFTFGKKRVFDSYFEGEQAGSEPQDKDVGFLVSAYDTSFNRAMTSRAYIRSLLEGTASDDRPLAAVSGIGRPVESPKGDSATFITPRSKPEEIGDYRHLDHHALRQWKWVASEEGGAQTYLQGDVVVHPEIYKKLRNILATSPLRQNPIGKFALGAVADLKGVLLGFSGFHQATEGQHAMFHKVNPWNPKEIDLNDHDQWQLVRHGLMVADHSGLEGFSEGLAAGGVITKLPVAGPLMQKYSTWLFNDYIPRLKMAMATEALARNKERYRKQLASGKLTQNQVLKITADQANAAFGELNYKAMGRHPLTQDIMRLIFLAPDFFESRARFVGQAARPYGREQSAALLRGALGMYAVGRVVNQALDGDPHWDRPFSIVVKGREYTLRTIQGDILHLLSDPRGFIYHRLNPTTTRTLVEMLTSRDQFGKKRDFSEQLRDLLQAHIPIPFQGVTKQDQSLIESLLASVGVQSYRHRTAAGRLASQYLGEQFSGAQRTPEEDAQSKLRRGLTDRLREKDPSAQDDIRNLIREKKLTPQEERQILRDSRLTDLQRSVQLIHDPEKALKVFEAASEEEKAKLRFILLQKIKTVERRHMEIEQKRALISKIREAVHPGDGVKTPTEMNSPMRTSPGLPPIPELRD